MKRFTVLAFILAFGSPAAPLSAANISPSGVLSWTPDGSAYDYTIKLTNSSSSDASIGTFWYAWNPGQDYLPTSPLSVSSPTGWTSTITHIPNSSTDGYAILWSTNSAISTDNVAIGGTLAFKFKSADTPAQLSGISPFYPGPPNTLVGDSFVYPGGPFSDPGHEFIVTSVPEPSAMTLGILGLASTYAGLRLRRKNRG